MPSFVKTVAQVMPGFGSPSMTGQAFEPAFTATPTTAVIPATGATTPSTGGSAFNPTGMPAPSTGKIRVRTSSVSAAVTTAFSITVTDGTTVLTVANFPASPAGAAIDVLNDFETDLGITSISVIFTLGGTVGTGIVADIQASLV